MKRGKEYGVYNNSRFNLGNNIYNIMCDYISQYKFF